MIEAFRGLRGRPLPGQLVARTGAALDERLAQTTTVSRPVAGDEALQRSRDPPAERLGGRTPPVPCTEESRALPRRGRVAPGDRGRRRPRKKWERLRAKLDSLDVPGDAPRRLTRRVSATSEPNLSRMSPRTYGSGPHRVVPAASKPAPRIRKWHEGGATVVSRDAPNLAALDLCSMRTRPTSVARRRARPVRGIEARYF